MGAMRRLAVVASLLASAPRPVAAQSRDCSGHDTETAESARGRATALLDANLGRSRVNVPALREAITAASQACAAGDARGLFQRAVAREALAEFDEAARDLDAFLTRHPDRTDDEFVRALRARLDRRVGRVAVLPHPTHRARVHVGGTWWSERDGAIAVLAGEVTIGATSAGFADVSTRVRVTAGQRVAVRLRTETEASVGGPELVLTPLAPRASALTVARTARARPLRPWAIAVTAGSGAMLALGVGLLVWRESAASTYASLGCERMTPAGATCLDTYERFRDANAASIGTLITGGALAITAGVMWYFDLRAPGTRAWTCGVGPLDVSCAVRF